MVLPTRLGINVGIAAASGTERTASALLAARYLVCDTRANNVAFAGGRGSMVRKRARRLFARSIRFLAAPRLLAGVAAATGIGHDPDGPPDPPA